MAHFGQNRCHTPPRAAGPPLEDSGHAASGGPVVGATAVVAGWVGDPCLRAAPGPPMVQGRGPGAAKLPSRLPIRLGLLGSGGERAVAEIKGRTRRVRDLPSEDELPAVSFLTRDGERPIGTGAAARDLARLRDVACDLIILDHVPRLIDRNLRRKMTAGLRDDRDHAIVAAGVLVTGSSQSGARSIVYELDTLRHKGRRGLEQLSLVILCSCATRAKRTLLDSVKLPPDQFGTVPSSLTKGPV